jgi:hypothetical protein
MRRIISSVVGMGVVLMAVTAVSAQSLADIAKRDNDRRKNVKHPAKVITNDDVQDTKPIVPMTAEAEAANASAAAAHPGAEPAINSDRPNDPPATGSAPPPSAQAPAAAPADDKAKQGGMVKAGDEAGWRARMQAARDAVSRTQLQLDSMRSRASQYTAASAAASDDQRAGVQAKQQQALQEYDRLRTDLTRFQKALSDLESEASRAGVPPGWLR